VRNKMTVGNKVNQIVHVQRAHFF